MYKTKLDPSIQAVVVSLDSKHTQTKLAMASLYLQQPDVKFIATTD